MTVPPVSAVRRRWPAGGPADRRTGRRRGSARRRVGDPGFGHGARGLRPDRGGRAAALSAAGRRGGAAGTERAEARTAALTGLSVPRAAIRVDALTVAAAPAMVTHGAPGVPGFGGRRGSGDGPRPRIRAERRVPSAVLAVAGAVACGLVLADVVTVRLGGAPAGWRTAVLDWAAAHGPADSAVRVGGAVAALAGVWLLGCALLPGGRRLRWMGRPHRSCGRSWTVRLRPASCASGRSASPGGRSAGRRPAAAGAGTGRRGYGDPEEVRSEAVRVLNAGLAELGLARTPVLRVGVQVRRDAGAEAIEPSAATPGTDRMRFGTRFRTDLGTAVRADSGTNVRTESGTSSGATERRERRGGWRSDRLRQDGRRRVLRERAGACR